MKKSILSSFSDLLVRTVKIIARFFMPTTPKVARYPSSAVKLKKRYIRRVFEDDLNIDDIKKQFDDLDMITTSAIAIMLSDAKLKSTSLFIRNMEKPNIRTVLLSFCRDSYFAVDIGQLNKMFITLYYKKKIIKYFRRAKGYIKRGISDSQAKQRKLRAFRKLNSARVQRNILIDRICKTLTTYESVKFIPALSANEKVSDSRRNYKLDHLSDNYKDALIYIVDVLLTCTCISKMLFIERKIKEMKPDSEFNTIIANLAQTIDDYDEIINKSRPIYKQYYKAELGYISGDELLYGMAITIMINKVRKVEINDSDVLKLKPAPRSIKEFDDDTKDWLDGLAKEDEITDIGTLILHKITLSIKNDFRILISALEKLIDWENYYDHRVDFYKMEREKERYLRGDIF